VVACRATPLMPNVRTEPGGLDAVGYHHGSQEDAPRQAAAFELQPPAVVMHTVVPVAMVLVLMVVALVEVALVFAPAIIIDNMVTVAGVADVALEAG
jgi:hypothetical protein